MAGRFLGLRSTKAALTFTAKFRDDDVSHFSRSNLFGGGLQFFKDGAGGTHRADYSGCALDELVLAEFKELDNLFARDRGIVDQKFLNC